MKQDFSFIKKQENIMRKLIKAALLKHNADELAEWLWEETETSDKEYLNKTMVNLAVNDNYLLIKCPNITDRDKIQEFVETNIFPAYNDQMANIFS